MLVDYNYIANNSRWGVEIIKDEKLSLGKIVIGDKNIFDGNKLGDISP